MQCDEKEEVQRIDPVEVQDFSREIRSSGSPERKTCETANKTVTSAIAGAGRTKPSYKHHGAEEDEEQGRRLDPSSRKIPPRRSAQNSLKPFNRRSKLKELRSRSKTLRGTSQLQGWDAHDEEYQCRRFRAVQGRWFRFNDRNDHKLYVITTPTRDKARRLRARVQDITTGNLVYQ